MVPELRFSGFNKTWTKKRLKEIGTFLGGGTPSKTNPDFWTGLIPWVSSSDITDDSIHQIKVTRFITEDAIAKSATKLVPENTILLVSRVGVGKLAVTTKKLCTSQDFANFTPSEGNVYFLAYYLKSKSTEFLKFNQGMAIQGFTKDDISNFVLYIPQDLEEQQKIGACLSSIDNLITENTKKLDSLKLHKKGLLQKLFPAEGENKPECRFREFDGDWKECLLDDIAVFLKGKGISKSDIDENGKLPCIRYGELYTQYQEVIDGVFSYTNVPCEQLVLSKKNDVLIPASGETQLDIATASCILNEGVALGGDLNIIRTKVNGVFLAYYLNGVKKLEIAQMAQGISVIHLYSSQLKNILLHIPNIKEQTKIASCLFSIDKLIHEQSQRVEILREHKKGLMQRLFPVVEGGAV